MRPAMERFSAAFRRIGDAPLDVLTHETPPGRRTCFSCGKRRKGSLVMTIDEEVFTACGPCTDDILRLHDEPSAT